MRFRGPLAGSYPSAVVLVLLALTPYLVLTTAVSPLDPLIEKDLGLGRLALELTAGMANAAYAFGTLLAAQFAMRLHGRRLLVLYAGLFVVGSVLAASAPVAGLFVAGRILQAGTTGLMLIAAVPPLVLNFGKRELPRTAVVMNMGIFGAVALGPVIGGIAAGTGTWRPLFWIVAGLGLGTVIFVLLTYEDQEPMDLSTPWDWRALALAALGTAAVFFAASWTSKHSFHSLPVVLPGLFGLAALATFLVYQYRAENSLIPLEKLAHTVPVAGILVAMVAGAVSVALIELTQTALTARHVSPQTAGMLFWPEFGGAVVAAVVFGRLFFTRWTPLLAFAGLGILTGAAAVLTGVATGANALVAVGSGLLGVGVGLSVAPALFVAAFSVPSGQLPRVFAVVELLRGVAAFLAGPLLLHLAMTTGGKPSSGIGIAVWVAFGLTIGGALLVLAMWRTGGARLHTPDADGWLDGDEPALQSPPLLARLRTGGRAAAGARG